MSYDSIPDYEPAENSGAGDENSERAEDAQGDVAGDSGDSGGGDLNPDSEHTGESGEHEPTDKPENSEEPEKPEEPENSDETDKSGERLLELRSVLQICAGMIGGDVDAEELRLLLDAIHAREEILKLRERLAELREEHEAEIKLKCEEAYTAGEIAGRNAVITEALLKSDEIPQITGAPLPSDRRPVASIFDLAATAR